LTFKDSSIITWKSFILVEATTVSDADPAVFAPIRQLRSGGAVSWKPRMQDRVSMSSTEAEYYALSEAACEAQWFRMLMGELILYQERATVILEDNESAINLAHNPVHHSRTKQIDIIHHLLRELVRYKEIAVCHVATKEQLGDALTKALSFQQFMYLTNGFMSSIL
jgi:hypothetical protein